MSVDELAQQYSLELNFDRRANTWLLLSTICDATIERLARLSRINAVDIIRLVQPRFDLPPPVWLSYCPICVFLNPEDVAAPCWRHAWLDGDATFCTFHAQPLQRLRITSLRKCGNFQQLLAVISYRESQRRQLVRHPIYPR